MSAILVFLRTLGFNVSQDEENAIRGIVGVLAPLAAALVIRSFVVSPATAQTAVNEAHAAGVAGTPAPPTVKA